MDLSCIDGFCPSFVTVENARRRPPAPAMRQMPDIDLPDPVLPPLSPTHDLLVTGVGGTGVVTVGQLITMAAHLQGLGASVLDFTGFAQKFGPVLSFIRLGAAPDAIHQVRIDTAAADAVIGGDVVVCSTPRASATYRRGTRIVLNMAAQPTGDIVLNRDADLQTGQRLDAIAQAVGADNVMALDAGRAAEQLMGDAIYANIILLGHAWQSGLVPVELPALHRAITLNGVKIDENRHAFHWGRVLAVRPDLLTNQAKTPVREAPADLIRRRAKDLTAYQNSAYADRYRRTLDDFTSALGPVLGAAEVDDLVDRAARSLYRLMAYKDEYEVARLATDPAFRQQLDRHFAPGYRLRYHLAPPFLQGETDARGRPRKRSFGPWMHYAFRLLATCRGLRGTPFDPFGHSRERKQERALIRWYEGVLDDIARHVRDAGADALADCRRLLDQPNGIRGFGPVKQTAMEKVLSAAAR